MSETNSKKNLNTIIIVLILIGMGYFVWYKYQEGLQAEIQLQQINVQNEVVNNAIQQYEIAKRQGDKIQIAVQAGLVAAAYLQANDEVNYDKWKAIEKEANKAAGLVIP